MSPGVITAASCKSDQARYRPNLQILPFFSGEAGVCQVLDSSGVFTVFNIRQAKLPPHRAHSVILKFSFFQHVLTDARDAPWSN
jgi:hypothetical protein